MWIDVNPEPDDLAFEVDLSNVAFSCDEHDLHRLADFFDDIGCDGTAETLRAAMTSVAYENRQMLRVIDPPRRRPPHHNLIAEADDVLERLLREEEEAIRRNNGTAIFDATAMNIVWDDPGVVSEPVWATPTGGIRFYDEPTVSSEELARAREQWEVLRSRVADPSYRLEAR